MLKIKVEQLLLPLLLALFFYVAARAWLVDITHDEAYSFYNMKKFWYAEALCTGNTHWLNSAAIKLAIICNFENLFAIRWFSVLSAFVFIFITFLWVKSVKEIQLKFLIVSVLLFNPYILDYFSMARGYASGMMFEALALFYFFRTLKEEKKQFQTLALFFAGLSPLSNFSYIYFFMAFCLVYFSLFYFKNGFSFLRNKFFYRDTVYSLLVSAIVIRAFMFMTKCSNDVVGAGTPFFSEYFHVFTDGLLYGKINLSHEQLTICSWFTFILLIACCIYGIAFKNKHGGVFYFYASIILSIILTVTFINHYCFRVVFPYYRSAIFLFPISAVCIINFLNTAITHQSLKKLLMLFISFALTLNFILSINFKSVFDFHIQANLKDSFDYVEKMGAKHVGISPELYGGYRNYYQMTYKYSYDFFGEPIHTNLPKGISAYENRLKEFDHIILFPPYDMSYYRNNKVQFKALKIFPETGTLILKVKD